jgi:hypothetical protein
MIAALPAAAIWPLLLGASASLATGLVAATVVVIQRQAGRRRDRPSSPP